MKTKCRSCQAEILMAVTDQGRRMPVDQWPAADDTKANLILVEEPQRPLHVKVVSPGEGTHVSHFATCPSAREHRRRK